MLLNALFDVALLHTPTEEEASHPLDVFDDALIVGGAQVVGVDGDPVGLGHTVRLKQGLVLTTLSNGLTTGRSQEAHTGHPTSSLGAKEKNIQFFSFFLFFPLFILDICMD